MMTSISMTRYVNPETFELVTVNNVNNTRSTTHNLAKLMAHFARNDKELEQIRLNLKPMDEN
jgi:hypothetical protein